MSLDMVDALSSSNGNISGVLAVASAAELLIFKRSINYMFRIDKINIGKRYLKNSKGDRYEERKKYVTF